MKYQRLSSGPPEAFVLVFDPGDEVVGEIGRFAHTEGVRAARLTGIGGFSEAKLGYFRRKKREYETIAVDEQVEVLSLVGDIALKDGQPLLHAHAVVGQRGGNATGGHLLSAIVWPTLEVFADVYPIEIVKLQRPALGIATIAIPL